MKTTIAFFAAFFALAQAQAEEKKAEEKKKPAAETKAEEKKEEAKEPEIEPITLPAPAGVGVEIALKVGGAVPLAKLGPSLSAALEGAYALPVLDKKLRVGIEARYQQPGTAGTLTDPAVQGGAPFAYTFESHFVALALPLSYRYDGGAWAISGGVAPALYLVHVIDTAFALANEETDTRIGAEAFGAFDYKLGPGAVTAEVRYNFVTWEFRSTGSAHAGAITASAGYRYTF